MSGLPLLLGVFHPASQDLDRLVLTLVDQTAAAGRPGRPIRRVAPCHEIRTPLNRRRPVSLTGAVFVELATSASRPDRRHRPARLGRAAAVGRAAGRCRGDRIGRSTNSPRISATSARTASWISDITIEGQPVHAATASVPGRASGCKAIDVQRDAHRPVICVEPDRRGDKFAQRRQFFRRSAASETGASSPSHFGRVR